MRRNLRLATTRVGAVPKRNLAIEQMDSTARATCWSVTVNMGKSGTRTETINEWISAARGKGWRVTGQVERAPTTGTQHYQLMVQTPQTRFSAIKRAFPTGHIEIARNAAALAQYVTKTDTRVGQLVDNDEKYPSAGRFWVLLYKHNNTHGSDGWDETDENAVRFYDPDKQQELDSNPLAWLDQEAGYMIRGGYVIDHLITNPAIRSFWKKFYPQVLYRARETDRQTDKQQVTLETHNTDGESGTGRSEATGASEAESTGTESEAASDADRQTDDCTTDGEQDAWL